MAKILSQTCPLVLQPVAHRPSPVHQLYLCRHFFGLWRPSGRLTIVLNLYQDEEGGPPSHSDALILSYETIGTGSICQSASPSLIFVVAMSQSFIANPFFPTNKYLGQVLAEMKTHSSSSDPFSLLWLFIICLCMACSNHRCKQLSSAASQ